MRIWEHTLEELTGGKQGVGDNDTEESEPMPFHIASVVPITDKAGWATALLNVTGASLANQVLLELNEGQWTYAGHYDRDTLMLRRHARRKGLGEELILRCTEHRHTFPLTSALTNAGYALLKRAHRLAIKRAIDAGLNVPQKVREEYAKG